MNLTEWSAEVHAVSKDHGWWMDADVKIVPEKLMLIVSELAEALEEYRIGLIQGTYYREEDNKPEGFGIELADAVIRICDLAAFLSLDLEELVSEKNEFNKSRSYRHGGKLC